MIVLKRPIETVDEVVVAYMPLAKTMAVKPFPGTDYDDRYSMALECVWKAAVWLQKKMGHTENFGFQGVAKVARQIFASHRADHLRAWARRHTYYGSTIEPEDLADMICASRMDEPEYRAEFNELLATHEAQEKCEGCGTIRGKTAQGHDTYFWCHGHCRRCWNGLSRAARYQKRLKPVKPCEKCGTLGGYIQPGYTRPARAKGMCQGCYSRSRRVKATEEKNLAPPCLFCGTTGGTMVSRADGKQPKRIKGMCKRCYDRSVFRERRLHPKPGTHCAWTKLATPCIDCGTTRGFLGVARLRPQRIKGRCKRCHSALCRKTARQSTPIGVEPPGDRHPQNGECAGGMAA